MESGKNHFFQTYREILDKFYGIPQFGLILNSK